ncbi:uncharacterized protein TNCV_542201 [Trichonephila clavipes]|nr:uncharacterized protein TNCV_542201 [Trichonephila clavipes]
MVAFRLNELIDYLRLGLGLDRDNVLPLLPVVMLSGIPVYRRICTGDNDLTKAESRTKRDLKTSLLIAPYCEYTKKLLFAGQIGGSLGLYLGASIITVVEILSFVASWLWYRICPSRTCSTKVRQDTTSHHRQAKGNAIYYEKSEYF